MQRKGRPRLSDEVRIRIVQIRARDRTPSLDRILDVLAAEEWDPIPSRGSVQNVVAAWEGLPEEIRTRDRPFEWHRLDAAEVPWDASEFILECQFYWDQKTLRVLEQIVASGHDTDILLEHMSNRVARWCSHIHHAAPDWQARLVLGIADQYASAERALDLSPRAALMSDTISGWDAVLRYRPDIDTSHKAVYLEAVHLGLVPTVLDIDGLAEPLHVVPVLSESQFFGSLGFILETRRWLEGILNEEADSHDSATQRQRLDPTEGSGELAAPVLRYPGRKRPA